MPDTQPQWALDAAVNCLTGRGGLREQIQAIATALAEARAAGSRAGQEAMREEAALQSFSQTSDFPAPGDWNEACEHVADIIRALPIEDEKEP